MKRFAVLMMVAVVAVSANAGVVVDTLPANDRAGFSDFGQTFTTGVLGAETNLGTIEIEGPRDKDTDMTAPVYLELYTDTDGDHATWDPGALVATSTNSVQFTNLTVDTFYFSGETLADSTVYALKFTDGAGTSLFARLGVTGTGAIPGPLADGTIFNAGAIQFGDKYDTAMKITTVPEPATMVLLGLGGLLLRRRRA